MSIALHPERTPDPQVVRWRYVGAVSALVPGRCVVPTPLEALGVRDVVSEQGAVVLRLAAGVSWARAGVGVRDALSALLAEGDLQVVETPEPAAAAHLGAAGMLDDAALAAGARTVLADEVDPVAGAHGGWVDLVSTEGGVVTVRMGGACHGCPAADITVHRRLEDALRRHVDPAVTVRVVPPEQLPGTSGTRLGSGGRRLLQWSHDRHRRGND